MDGRNYKSLRSEVLKLQLESQSVPLMTAMSVYKVRFAETSRLSYFTLIRFYDFTHNKISHRAGNIFTVIVAAMRFRCHIDSQTDVYAHNIHGKQQTIEVPVNWMLFQTTIS